MVANAVAGQKGFVPLPWKARFWMRVEKTGGCWAWRGSKTPQGYGQLHRNGRREYAHRLSFELANGAIPDGMEIDHLCRNKGCVNPAHLEAVTHRENMRRVPYAERGLIFLTHCKRGHEMTEANSYWQPDGKRRCRQCRALRDRQRKAALKQARGEA